MALVLHLQNLPRLANNLDIREFFAGLHIMPGGVQILGGLHGDAFIKFSTEDDLLKSLSLDNQAMLRTPVRLYLAKETDMKEVMARRKQHLASCSRISGHASPVQKQTSILPGIPSPGPLQQKHHLSDLESYSTKEFKRQKISAATTRQFVHSPDSTPSLTMYGTNESVQRWHRDCDNQIEYQRGDITEPRDALRNVQGNQDSLAAQSMAPHNIRDNIPQDHTSTRALYITETSTSNIHAQSIQKPFTYSKGPMPLVRNCFGYETQTTRSRPFSATPEPGYIEASNIPITTTAADIREFFIGHVIAEGGITMKMSNANKNTLIAYIKFINMKDAIRVDCICDGFKLQGNIISIRLISKSHRDSALVAGSNEEPISPRPMSHPVPSRKPPVTRPVLPRISNATHLKPSPALPENKASPMLNPTDIIHNYYIVLKRPQNLKYVNAASTLLMMAGGPEKCFGVCVTRMEKKRFIDEAILAFRTATARHTINSGGSMKVISVNGYMCNGLKMLAYLKTIALRNQNIYIGKEGGPDISIFPEDEKRLRHLDLAAFGATEINYSPKLDAQIKKAKVTLKIAKVTRHHGAKPKLQDEKTSLDKFTNDQRKVINKKAMLPDRSSLDTNPEVTASGESGKDDTISDILKNDALISQEAAPMPTFDNPSKTATVPITESEKMAKTAATGTLPPIAVSDSETTIAVSDSETTIPSADSGKGVQTVSNGIPKPVAQDTNES